MESCECGCVCVYHFKFTSKAIRIAHVNSGKFYDMELVSFSFVLFEQATCLWSLLVRSPSSSRIVHGKLVQKTFWFLCSFSMDIRLKDAWNAILPLTNFNVLQVRFVSLLFASSYDIFERHTAAKSGLSFANSIVGVKPTWIGSLNANHRSENDSILHAIDQTLHSIDCKREQCDGPYRLVGSTHARHAQLCWLIAFLCAFEETIQTKACVHCINFPIFQFSISVLST